MNRRTRRVVIGASLVAALAAAFTTGYGLGYSTAPHTKDVVGIAYNSAPTEAAKEAVRREAGILFGAIFAASVGLLFFFVTRARRNRAVGVAEEPKTAVVQGRSEEVAPRWQQSDPSALDLLAEIRKNVEIASHPQKDELLPFETSVWDRDGVRLFTGDSRGAMNEAYADMRLANRIVWLATDLGRRNDRLTASYLDLCAKIADRLGRVNPLADQSGPSAAKNVRDR